METLKTVADTLTALALLIDAALRVRTALRGAPGREAPSPEGAP